MDSDNDNENSRPLVWYYDVVSPFAYIALPTIEALARQHAVQFRPVLLGGMLKHWGQLAPAEIPPKRIHTYRLSQFVAERAGLSMRFPPRHPFRSLDLQRLLSALDDQPGAARTAFDFIWAEGRDPTEPSERDVLCARLGIRNVEALIDQTGAKDRLRRSTDAAIQAGVFGVPTLAIGDALFWGVDALPMAGAYLANHELFSQGEMARLAGLPVGAERKP